MTPEQVNILCRLVFDTCALFLWGAHGFLWLAVAKDLAKHIEHRLARFFHLALLLMVIAGIGKIAAQAALLGDGWQTVTPTLVADLLQTTRSGAALGLQAGLTGALLLAYCIFRHHRGIVVTLFGALVLISLSISGHAIAETGATGLLHRVNHSLHLLAASLWLGALPPVVLLLQAMQDERARPPTLAALMRFSTIGHVAVALTLISGALNAWLIVGAHAVDISMPYQRLLLFKIGVVAAMVIIAIINRYVFVPRMHHSPASAIRAIRIGTLAECGLGLAAVALVSAFGTMQPG
ncbi:copper homeostasis membrane protein CopD [Agrobacterium vitis]|uniref:copper homeostasis membrane protein CopD n=1 Tax=Agrobacterium vitis TaxID=373 RepID=UPI0012E83F8F|nr:copper homeostasis membrane protein CopD [Agrobacterium vitis]